MDLISIVVFAGAFAVVALVLAALSPRKPKRTPAAPMAARSAPIPTIEDVRKVVKYSAIPWMNRFLLNMKLAPRLRLLLYQAEMKWTVGQLILMCLVCGVLPSYAAFLRTQSMTVSLAIGSAACCAPFGLLMLRRHRRFERFEEELPKALDLIVNALRAGHSFNAALELAARESSEPVRREFRMCFDEQHFGLDLRDAMENLALRVPLKHVRIFATVVVVQKDSGGNLAEVLHNTATVIRDRSRLRRQVLVHTAQGRLTGWVIGLLPLALLVLLYAINPELESLLWKREAGVKLLTIGASMMAIGGIMIRNIVRLDV